MSLYDDDDTRLVIYMIYDMHDMTIITQQRWLKTATYTPLVYNMYKAYLFTNFLRNGIFHLRYIFL